MTYIETSQRTSSIMASQMGNRELHRGYFADNYIGLNACNMRRKWWRARRDSNPQPPVPKTGALSIELRALSVCIIYLNREFVN